MTSEIRVNKIENRSGLGTVTFADTGVDLAGIVTATTFSGSGASLTDLPAASLTGTVADARFPATLPATSAANLTNVPAANVVGVHTSLTVTNATTTGTAVVGGGVTISESGIEASGIGITCANINGTQIGGRRNLIINGAMQVAQRGTSSTSSGFYTVDRFQLNFTGTNEAPTQAQVALSSGDTPYSSGFRYAYKVTNGNQTGGGGAAKFIRLKTTLEAQDIASSGWDYVSSSSFVTLSFWVKASIAQTYYGRLQTEDGTARNFPFSFALSENTWTKVIKTIPGSSSPALQFDNNVNAGLFLEIIPYYGTDYTGSMSLNTWATYSDRTPDNTATWYEADDATFEITGVQLEVGSQATPFEHRSFGEEQTLCERYCQTVMDGADANNGNQHDLLGMAYTDNNIQAPTPLRTRMRAAPSISATTGAFYWKCFRLGSNIYMDGLAMDRESTTTVTLNFNTNSGGSISQGEPCYMRTNSSAARILLTSEL